MYLANRVEETTTTIGASDLTLLGASTNYRTFNDAYGIAGRRFLYWVVDDDTNFQWENGIGYLSDATTLVREKILSNSDGTTSALVLGAGTKRVFVGSSEGSYTPAWPDVYDEGTGQVRICTAHLSLSNGANSFSMVSGLFSAMPYLVLHEGLCTSVHLNITTASTTVGSLIRLGIYTMKGGRPGILLAETDDIAFDAISNAFHPWQSPVYLTPGWYFTCAVSNDVSGVARVLKQNGTITNNPMGFTTDTNHITCHGGSAPGYASWTSMPNPAPTLTSLYTNTSLWGLMPPLVFST